MDKVGGAYGDDGKDRDQRGPYASDQREYQKPLDDGTHPRNDRVNVWFVEVDDSRARLYPTSSLLLHSRMINTVVMEISTAADVACTVVNTLCIASVSIQTYDGVANTLLLESESETRGLVRWV